jgi:ribosomal protein S18 acetylase RimI-like enzyme
MVEEAGEQAEILGWDSGFWGFRTARVVGDTLTSERVRQLDDWCRREGVRCLYFLARSDDSTTTHLAETSGFRSADVRLTLERRNPSSSMTASLTVEPSPPPRQGAIRQARPDDLAALQRIARESHRDSRFYYDPGFPRPLCDLLYETWIKVDLDGAACQVLVAEIDGVPVGYITCHLDDSRAGRISLVGVESRAQGRGIGRALVDGALSWFAANAIAAKVVVTTQGRNVAAQRLYQRCGFVTQAVQLWYHKWYPTGGDR